jgi:TPR repeat protein
MVLPKYLTHLAPGWWRLLLLLSCAGGPSAWGQDFDIVSSDRERRAAVEPLCAALVSMSTDPTQEQKYYRALCWLYGVIVPVQRDKALEALRELALQGNSPAQLALADSLQSGSKAEMREALQWYDRVAAAGESRVQLRRARVAQRLAQMETAPEVPPNNAPDPFDYVDDSMARTPGYHCHVFGRRKVCHGGMDF